MPWIHKQNRTAVILRHVPRAVLWFCTCTVVGCSTQAAPPVPREERVPVKVAQVRQQALPPQVVVIGTVETAQNAIVKSLADGQVVSVSVTDGAEVTVGQRLLAVDPRPLQAECDRARSALNVALAAFELARAQVSRYESVAASNFISAEQMHQRRSELAAATARVSLSRAELRAATLGLEHADIVAPISGKIGKIMVHVGDTIRAQDGQALLTINQLAPIYVAFSVSGNEIARVRAAQNDGAIRVFVDGRGLHQKIEGKFSFLDNSVDPGSNTIKLRAVFANDNRELFPGQLVDVTAQLGSDEQVLTVPSSAVRTGPNGNYVFIVDANAHARQRSVRIDRAAANVTSVGSGLEVGEAVVIDGQSRITDGSAIQAVETR